MTSAVHSPRTEPLAGESAHRRPRRRAALVSLAALVVLAVAVGAMVDLRIATAAFGLVLLTLVASLITLSKRDVLTVLTLTVALLLLLPQPFVLVGPLKSVGNPAQLMGLVALALWGATRIMGLLRARPLHPIRWAIFFFALASLTAYGAAMNRILSEAEQASNARSVFPVLATLGIGLLAVDGLRSRPQVETLLQRIVWIGGLAALIGIGEFVAGGFKYRDALQLPGLTTTADLVDDTRAGFDRIQAAASHPIEYSVTLAALVPLALHFTLYSRLAWQRRLSLVALVCILAVNPMSVSRSGILTLGVGVLVYAVHLSNRARLNLLVLGLIGLAVYRVMVPGLLGTLRGLLLIGQADTSIAARTEDYAAIPGLTRGFEIFGRGFGTFDPVAYFLLDNQYLGTLLEGGLVSLYALIALFVVGVGVARGVRRRSRDHGLRGIGQAMAGGIASLALAAAFFDLLSFRQATFVLFLLLGCAGALWTVVREQIPGGTRPLVAAPDELPERSAGPVVA